MTTDMIEEKCSRGNHGEKMLDGLRKKLDVGQVADALKAMRHLDRWTDMMAKSRGHSTRLLDELVDTVSPFVLSWLV